MICAELEFDAEAHVYLLGDETLPSVTQVIGWFGQSEFADLKARGVLREEHMRIGTLRHEVTELHDRGELEEDGLDPVLVDALTAWKQFRSDSGFSAGQIEQRIYSARERYAGTIDRIGTLADGRSILIDIKGPASSASHVLQLGAYSHAWTEQTGHRVDIAACVHLRGKAYRVVSHEREKLDSYEEDFVTLARAHRVVTRGCYRLGR